MCIPSYKHSSVALIRSQGHTCSNQIRKHRPYIINAYTYAETHHIKYLCKHTYSHALSHAHAHAHAHAPYAALKCVHISSRPISSCIMLFVLLNSFTLHFVYSRAAICFGLIYFALFCFFSFFLFCLTLLTGCSFINFCCHCSLVCFYLNCLFQCRH